MEPSQLGVYGVAKVARDDPESYTGHIIHSIVMKYPILRVQRASMVS